jgi:superoxide dismutase
MGFTIIKVFFILSLIADHLSVKETISSFLKANRGLETMGVSLPIVLCIDAFEHTYNQWYTKKRAELMAMMERKKKGVDLEETVLGEII